MPPFDCTHRTVLSGRCPLQGVPSDSGRQSSWWGSRTALASTLACAAGAVAVTSSVKCDSSKQEDHDSIVLRDGRRLAYRIHGHGVPVVAFHGMESSRHTWDTMMWGQPPESPALLYPGIQVIAVDRPGYGDSTTPPQGYNYKDFVLDLTELTDSLKLRRFCVAGHSSGGPYALAAAALLPDRVVSCAAISADAPYAHPKADEALRKSGADMQCDALIRSGYYGGEKSKSHQWKQGPMGFVCDYALERIEWPFLVESITQGPRITIWVGSKDVDCIVQSAKFLHNMIPGSKLCEQPRGHGFKKDLAGNCEFKFLGEIFTELKAQWEMTA